MNRFDMRTFYLPICALIGLFYVLLVGCNLLPRYISSSKPIPPQTKKIVVFGFKPAISEGEKPGVIRSPVSGTVFMAEPVPQDIADRMTAKLFEKLLKTKNYSLISPNQAKGVLARLVSYEQILGDVEIFKKIGRAFSGDAVMAGYIYRWQEREGTDYSVNRPASAAFDLYMVRPDDGAILWKGKFDKTQRSLSENILDLKFFLMGRGRWMTVERLAHSGLTDLLGKSALSEQEPERD